MMTVVEFKQGECLELTAQRKFMVFQAGTSLIARSSWRHFVESEAFLGFLSSLGRNFRRNTAKFKVLGTSSLGRLRSEVRYGLFLLTKGTVQLHCLKIG